jgi:hypothetical protein
MLCMKISYQGAKTANLTAVKFELLISSEDHFSDIVFLFRASFKVNILGNCRKSLKSLILVISPIMISNSYNR